jgi:hypothetical protein
MLLNLGMWIEIGHYNETRLHHNTSLPIEAGSMILNLSMSTLG